MHSVLKADVNVVQWWNQGRFFPGCCTGDPVAGLIAEIKVF